MGRRIYQQVPTPMPIDLTGISSANRQMSVTAWDQVIFVKGDGGPVNVTANPQIEAHERTGAILRVVGMDDTDTLTLEDGDGLWLNGTAVLKENRYVELLWCGDRYIECGRNF